MLVAFSQIAIIAMFVSTPQSACCNPALLPSLASGHRILIGLILKPISLITTTTTSNYRYNNLLKLRCREFRGSEHWTLYNAVVRIVQKFEFYLMVCGGLRVDVRGVAATVNVDAVPTSLHTNHTTTIGFSLITNKLQPLCQRCPIFLQQISRSGKTKGRKATWWECLQGKDQTPDTNLTFRLLVLGDATFASSGM